MRRGDVVTVALPGDYGKPRPALVVQADLFNTSHASITVLPITSDIVPAPLFRITIEPTPATGLRTVSQVMVDKIIGVRRERIGQQIGRMDEETMVRVTRAMAVWLAIT